MSEESSSPPRGGTDAVASAARSRRRWRSVLAVGAAALGLYLTVAVTVRLIHRAEGYDAGVTDCDDCGLTFVLDNLGWVAVAVAGYLGVLLLGWWLLRTRRRSDVGSPGS